MKSHSIEDIVDLDKFPHPKSTLYLADCIEGMKLFPDNHFDLAVVDPPYGIDATAMAMGQNLSRPRKDGTGPGQSTARKLKKRNRGSGKLKNRVINKMGIDWDHEQPTIEYWTELFRVSKNQVIFGGNYFPLPPTRCYICWDKMQPWENFSQIELAWTSFDKPAIMIRKSTTGGNNKTRKIHPTQKPVDLYCEVYRRLASPGMKVLDTHHGSGSNRIAADMAGLEFVGFEVFEPYYMDSCDWFAAHVKEPPLFSAEQSNYTQAGFEFDIE